MNHLDIFFDLETCSKKPNAAVLQLAAVACDLSNVTTPWLMTHGEVESFNMGAGLAEQFLAGCHFDQETQTWWMKQKKEAQDAVLECEGTDMHSLMMNFNMWIEDLKATHGAKSVCIWAQGSDFDIPKLRNMYDVAGIKEQDIAFKYNMVRCARTYCLEEMAYRTGDRFAAFAEIDGKRINDLYKQIPPVQVPEGIYAKEVHDALYDSIRSAWNVWYLMNNRQHLSE